MIAGTSGLHTLDLGDHIHPFGDLDKDGITPALNGLGGIIEEIVLLDVDEELGFVVRAAHIDK